MRAVWIDQGITPRGDLRSRWNIQRAYFPSHVTVSGEWMRNPRLSADFLYGPAPDRRGGWNAAIGGVGIYFGSSWPIFTSPIELARELDAMLTLIGADNRRCAVHNNREAHDFDLVAFLHEFRAVRPTRELSWVIEGMQGGRISAPQLRAINGDPNLTVLAENFYDEPGRSMIPIDADRVRCDLIDYGVRRERAAVMYDAAHLADRWDGCAFTQNRLPA